MSRVTIAQARKEEAAQFAQQIKSDTEDAQRRQKAPPTPANAYQRWLPNAAAEALTRA